VTKPLRQFANSADEIAKGNFNARLPYIRSKDEMKRLHDSFETMQRSLVRQIEETRTVNEEKGRMESELLIARNIQMAMLPKTFPPFPDRHDIDIYAQLTPAKEVGGDLFDFFIRDEKLFFCIGDVSGKGVPASLVMAVTRSLFRIVAANESKPEIIVGKLNDAIAQDNDSNMFVTLFVGILHLPTGVMDYCNAGHDSPLLVGSGVGMLPCESNLPIGVVADWNYVAQQTVVYSSTTIFLYTDGLTEAEDAAHRQFGEEQILSVATAQLEKQQYGPQQLIGALTNAVARFVGDAEQSDDLTMLAIQYFKEKES
jgi:sigma-B regulation protein RsbU (phosphoserine phosphatase)